MLPVIKLIQAEDGSLALKGTMPKIVPGEDVWINLYDERLTGDLPIEEIFPITRVKEALAKYLLEQGFIFFLDATLIQRGLEGAKERGNLLLVARFGIA